MVCLLVALPAMGEQPAITIGVSLSLTGKYAAMGDMQEKGFRLWERDVNAQRPLLGRNVHMIIRDDQSNPDVAKTIYAELIGKDRVDLVFGPYSSGISEAILPITEMHKYPILLSGASADELWEKGYRYAFGVYTPASKYAVGFLEMLVTKKIKDIAIVSTDDAFSICLAAGTQKWAQKFQLHVSLFERFQKGTSDLSQVASRVKLSGAKALVVCGHMEESVDMRRALQVIGWFPKAYYASVGPATKDFYEMLGTDANLVFSSSQWEAAVGVHFPYGKQFVDTFRDVYKQAPSYHAATAYAAGMILEEALHKVGSLNKERLRDTLASMDTMTVIGRYGVDTTGWQMRHFPLIIQWQGGKRRVVWPETLKQSDPIINE